MVDDKNSQSFVAFEFIHFIVLEYCKGTLHVNSKMVWSKKYNSKKK